MGCAASIVKYLVFIFNFVLALAGLALLIVGILLERQISKYGEFLDGKFHAPPIIIIVIGCIVFVVAFFGCCGAIRESHCMLVTYAILVLTIFILQIVAAGLAFAYRDDTNDIIQRKIEDYVGSYESDKNSKSIMDNIQSNLKCCGYNGPQDYTTLTTFPTSCCPNPATCLISTPDRYNKGCGRALQDLIKDQGNIIGGVAIGIAAVEVVAIIFGLCLANSIKNENRRGR